MYVRGSTLTYAYDLIVFNSVSIDLKYYYLVCNMCNFCSYIRKITCSYEKMFFVRFWTILQTSFCVFHENYCDTHFGHPPRDGKWVGLSTSWLSNKTWRWVNGRHIAAYKRAQSHVWSLDCELVVTWSLTFTLEDPKVNSCTYGFAL